MTNKWKLAAAAALMATGLASGISSPAFAHTHHVATRALHRSADPRSGLNAFDMVPGGSWNSYSPGATGGGSLGYNENLRTDQW
jgi:hypothetical protein